MSSNDIRPVSLLLDTTKDITLNELQKICELPRKTLDVIRQSLLPAPSYVDDSLKEDISVKNALDNIFEEMDTPSVKL